MLNTPINNTQDNPGAFIIDGLGRADLGVIRALGERGIPIYFASSSRATPAYYSRYITQRFDFPSPKESDSVKISALTKLGQLFKHKPVFFSTGDTTLLLFARNKNKLEQYFQHHIGNLELIEKLNDKTKFARLSSEYQLPVPYSLAPESLSELQNNISNFTFPTMVKPAEKKNWDKYPEVYDIAKGNLKGIRTDSAEELIQLYKDLTPYDNRIVIQNYIEGRDESIWSLHIYINRNGEVTGWFTGQKIRTYPIHRGIGCFQLSKINNEVYNLGKKALTDIGYTGHAIVQVKQLPETNSFEIFEINCRYSTWNYLHTQSGVNLPLAAYNDSMGKTPGILPNQIEGTRWIDVSNDIKAFTQYTKIGEWEFIPWIRTYLGNNCYAILDWKDSAPLLIPKIQKLLSLPKRVFNRISKLFHPNNYHYDRPKKSR